MAIENSLTILSDEGISELYNIPKIDQNDRVHFFQIEPEDIPYLDEQTDVYNKINYILQVGYFRASRNFYSFSFKDVREDVWFIINTHYPEAKFPKKDTARNRHYQSQRCILDIHSYKRYDASSAIIFDQQVKKLSKRDLNPKFIFDELLGFCEQHKIVRYIIREQRRY
jgi:hypothetical protein